MLIEGIRIFIVSDAITVGIHRLFRIIWELIDVVVNSITVPVKVGVITDAVFVIVVTFLRIEREGIGIVTNAVAVAVLRLLWIKWKLVGVVANSIAIAILRFVGIVRESIGAVTDTIVV